MSTKTDTRSPHLRDCQKGQSFISILIALVIIAIGFSFYSQSTQKSHETIRRYQDIAVASEYATELLELFRSLSNTNLNTYLFSVPSVPPSTFTTGPLGANIPLCAHINILDRSSGNIFNQDPLANLPANNPLDRGTAVTNSNRYYQVQVINAATLTINNAPCLLGVPPASPGYVFNPAVNPNERFFITVHVTFIPVGKTVADVQTAVASAIIPEI